jgi:hypothetical protein
MHGCMLQPMMHYYADQTSHIFVLHALCHCAFVSAGPVLVREQSCSAGHPHLPSLFWMDIDSSGVSIMRVPSVGLWNITPSYVISARCSSDTICMQISRQSVTSSTRMIFDQVCDLMPDGCGGRWPSLCTMVLHDGCVNSASQPLMLHEMHGSPAAVQPHHTWKPPESVSMPLGHDTKSWRPPISATKSLPGLFCRWYVLPRMTWQSSSSSCSGVRPLTEPWVPTGMNMGVCAV